MERGDLIELRAERMVAGGDVLSHAPDGRVVFIDGALPGELVNAQLNQVRKDHCKASVVEILEPSSDRVTPVCPHVAGGCGGCSWQHAQPSAQGEYKRAIVIDALRRIAHVEDIEVQPTVQLRAVDYRTTLRAAVAKDGSLSLRKRSSHELVGIEGCWVAHPLVRDIVDNSRIPGAREVTIRVGAHTGERLVIIDGEYENAYGPTEGVTLVDIDDRVARYHEMVNGRRLRISVPSFFQSHVDAPAALVAAVQAAIGSAPIGRLVDLYCGVGLFAAFVDAEEILAVESSRIATRDAKHNLKERNAIVVCADVDAADLGDCDVAIADPPRDGLAKKGLTAILNADPERVVLVSCDAAAGARDTRALLDSGYRLTSVQPIDQFPHTHHVEIVSGFHR